MAKRQGNTQALVNWVGQVGWYACVSALPPKKGRKRAERICGKLKGLAKKQGVLSPLHAYGKRHK